MSNKHLDLNIPKTEMFLFLFYNIPQFSKWYLHSSDVQPKSLKSFFLFFFTAHPIFHENHVSSAWEIYPEWAINSPTDTTNVIQAAITLPGDYYNSPVLFPCFHPSLPSVSIQQSNQSNLLRCKSHFCRSLFQPCNVLPSSSKYNPNFT